MPEGFSTVTPDGYRQLTNNGTYFTLVTKVELSQSNWAASNAMGTLVCLEQTVFVNGITLSDAPIVALSCAFGTYAVTSNFSSGINIRVLRTHKANPPPVTLYVFSRKPPVDPGRGLALYRNNQIVFSIINPIVKPLGAFDNNGYAGVGLSGKTLAHVPQRYGRGSVRTWNQNGPQSCSATGPSGQPVSGRQDVYRDTNYVRFVAISGSSVYQDYYAFTPANDIPFGGCNPGWTGNPPPSYTQTDGFRSLIIDVSNI